MESKLLIGGTNIVDHTNEQQRALEQRRREIAEQQVSTLLKDVIRHDDQSLSALIEKVHFRSLKYLIG